jgi:hypothetical protein
MKPNRKWLIAAAIVLVLVVPIVIKKNRGASATEVDLATATPQLVQPSILASGTLAFRNEVNLTSEVTGKVRTLLVRKATPSKPGRPCCCSIRSCTTTPSSAKRPACARPASRSSVSARWWRSGARSSSAARCWCSRS